MSAISRRQLLGTGAAAASMLPPSRQRAMAEPMRPGGLRAIEQVVVLAQENRSFDHYLGTLQRVRGYGDRTPLVLRNASTIFEQPVAGPAGKVLPYSVREGAEAQLRPRHPQALSLRSSHATPARRDPPGRLIDERPVAAPTMPRLSIAIVKTPGGLAPG